MGDMYSAMDDDDDDDDSDIIQFAEAAQVSTNECRNLIDAQNQAFADSLAIDHDREANRIAMHKREHDERTRRQNRNDRKRAEDMRREGARAQLGEEPEDGITIRFMHANWRATRTFKPTNTRAGLYLYLEGHTRTGAPRLNFECQHVVCDNTPLDQSQCGTSRQCLMHVTDEYDYNEEQSEGTDLENEVLVEQEAASVDTLDDLHNCRLEIQSLMLHKKRVKIIVKRGNVVQKLVDHYQLHPDTVHSPLDVMFEDEEMAIDLDGVQKEMFTCFFQELLENECEGRSAKVPRMSPKRLSNKFWEAVGCIISHAFVLHGLFPIQLSLASVCVAISGKCTNEVLQASFVHYLNENDRIAMEKASKDFDSVRACLINILANNGGETLPTKENYKEELMQVAHTRLLCQPLYPLILLKLGLGMHGLLWVGRGEQTIQDLYRSLWPSCAKVI